jgi:hypothetical protein
VFRRANYVEPERVVRREVVAGIEHGEAMQVACLYPIRLSSGSSGPYAENALDRTLFWTANDLEGKLLNFQHYYNEHRTHAGRRGHPPVTGNADRHEQISVLMDGRSIVEAYTKRRLLHD